MGPETEGSVKRDGDRMNVLYNHPHLQKPSLACYTPVPLMNLANCPSLSQTSNVSGSQLLHRT